MRILVMHGPNLNLLGKRETSIYGQLDFEAVNGMIEKKALSLGVTAEIFQSNHEGAIIDKLHEAMGKYDAVVLNAGAYTHTSYAIMDAIKAIGLPVVEVHMSNIHAREAFRHTSVIAPACVGQIAGFGAMSYTLALTAVVNWVKDKR
ncbi:MAG: type II 3-dehydroquinate dehydratase [Hyphomonadaceae bacterium]|nr:type II 3-dehydroquinate dehydratase [Clostridia bacterium]